MQANPQLPTVPPLPGVVAVPAINDAIQTVATDFSGDTDPAAYAWPYSRWADTANGVIKRRNAAGSAWVVEGRLFVSSPGVYASGQVPTTDVGPIVVDGRLLQWNGSRYASNNLPTLYRKGGNCSVSGNSVTFAAGSWRGAADDADIVLSAPMSKTLQSSGAWASGSGANGLFSGSRSANTWYHCFVIYNPATGQVDAGFDTSVTAANRPSGWVAYRRVWSILTDGTPSILPMIQSGNRSTYIDRRSDISNAGVTNASTGATFVISTPSGVEVLADVALSLSAGGAASISLFKPGSVGAVGTVGDIVSTASSSQYSRVEVATSSTSGIVARASTLVTQGFYLSTVGWTDFIGD